MIINAEKGDIKVIGDIREFKTSIDPKNLEFITTLLSSNLYSDPEQSFIREIVSNAWDSHVEAGTTDVPVIVRFRKNGVYWEVTIRDFGTGLSPERFQEVYCNIGSSTKRESNDFIGGFGIGKYSSLACSNTVYITSYYNGTAFLYVMVKSGNTITTNLVMKKPTEEKNGVEVTIKNIYNIEPYKRALRYIVFFPNVYIEGIDNENNTTKLKRFNNFAAASCRIDPKILLGNVLYPCNESMLSSESKDFLDNIGYSGIVIKFDVGEISITPNRESIIYSSDTVAKINKRISDAKKELDGMVAKRCNRDYDNLYELYLVVRSSIGYDPIDDSYSSVANRYSMRENSYYTTVDTSTITFKGAKLSNDKIDIIKNFFGINLPNIKGLFHNGKFYQTKMPMCVDNRLRTKCKQIVCLTGSTRLTSAAKSWLEDNYSEYTIITNFTKEEFKSYILDTIPILKSTQFLNRDILIGYMYDYIMSNITPINIDTNSDFLSYKANIKANKVPTVKIKDFIIYVQKSKDYRDREYFKDIGHCIEYIKGLKKGVILTDMQGSDSWYDIANARGLEFIRARKDIVEAFEKLNPTFLVDKEWMITKDPTIVKLHTILKCFDGKIVPTKYSVGNMLETVPESLKDKFLDIINFYYRFSSANVYVSMARTRCTDVDEYTEYICKELIKYNDIYNKTCLDIDFPPSDRSSLNELLITAVLVKNKAYRISPKAYRNIKNNKLLRVLCRK